MRGCATWHTSFLSDLRRNDCREGHCFATTRVCHVAHFSTFPVGLPGIPRQTQCTRFQLILRNRWSGASTRFTERPAQRRTPRNSKLAATYLGLTTAVIARRASSVRLP